MVKLGLGMMRLPVLNENDFSSVDYNQVSKMVDALMDVVSTVLILLIHIMKV